MTHAIVGYIIQSLDDDNLTPPMGAKTLFIQFKDAIEHAKTLYQTYMEAHEANIEGPFEVYKPTREQVDFAGGAMIFRSRDIQIWIDCVTRY